ncbi:NAD-dependent epimerase/dehydratase family protein [Archangium violaceum]|uniref:NAD-dependent epimerase/dehydratase family protein n=1 Tax=Archangium violaceum TaxID=83451 RepID=UPI00193BD067|nr:NAD-dependent epimerase/dehydratase family protein [Archangium violaceum]QRK11554.1 NAD-dependent epimerase/dehydratase family protein [Archangium violaceum]
MSEQGKVALFGASGVIGQSVVQALRAQGREFRVVGRSMSSLRREFGSDPRAELVTWNPEDPASVRAAARGVHTLIYLVGLPYTDFRMHPVLTRRTLEGAIAEGVKRLVQIGTLYSFGRPRAERVTEEHPREPHTFKGKMRKQQEDLVLEAGASGAIQTTILRLPDFYGPNVERSFLHGAFRAALDGKHAQLIGPIDRPHEFVFVPDVGPVVTALMDEPRAYGRTWNLGGAGITTQRELAERIFAEVGRRPKLMVANRPMLRVLGLFDPVLRELFEMHYLLTEPLIVDDSALRSLLGEVKKTPYAEGIRLSLAAMREQDAAARRSPAPVSASHTPA